VQIAIDCRYVRERPSGIGVYVQALVDRLPWLAPEWQWLLLRHPRSHGALSHTPNVREVVVPYEPGGPVTMWGLPHVVDLSGVDLFHATFNLAPARLPCPVVTTIHDIMWVEAPELCRVPGPWGYVETLFWRHGIARAIARSERILTVSEASATRIAARFPEARARTHVTQLGVDASWRPPQRDEHALIKRVQAQRAPGSRRFVLAVGQAAGYKNHDGVARAFASAFSDDPSIHLVFVQRIGRNPALRQLVHGLGIASRVHFIDSVPFEELRALFWGAICLCHPSHVEGFGLPVLEALASGCPVIASDLSALPEVTGGAALHVDPTDTRAIAAALMRLSEHQELRALLSVCGMERASEMSWDRTAEGTLSVFREVLESSRHRVHCRSGALGC
jgi:alpha-1,3-rhamnosyl/mannosyltransferase